MTENKRYYRTNVNLGDNNNEPYYNIRDRKKEENNVLFMVSGKYISKNIIDLLNEQEKQIQELKKEKEYWKGSACHDANLKSMLSFEIGKLTETKDVDSFLDFYYKYFCKISGDVE